MIENKWIVGVRNKLVELSGECNSCAAIDGARMTSQEREELRELLRKASDYIDRKLKFYPYNK